MRIDGNVSLAAALVATFAVYVGCNVGSVAVPSFTPDGGASGPAAVGPPTTPACGGDPTLASIQDTVFDKSCAFSSCHGGATPAAGLNLTAGRACASLVGKASCVFSNRTRVVPGHPEQSYLYAKISGKDLGTSPDGTCAGLTNGTPQRMPLGGEPLCQAAIDQVAAWITAGAQCDLGSDAGAHDGAPDAAPDTGPPPIALQTTTPTFAAGNPITVTLSLAQPAPTPGQPIALKVSDATALATPGEAFVPAGATSVSFQVNGLRPARVKLQAGGAELALLVTGLSVAEVLYNDNYGNTTGMQWVKIHNTTAAAIDLSLYTLGAGVSSYAETTAQLAGTLAPGACFVVGGPTTRYANGSPVYTMVHNFAPPLPADGTGAGVALFDLPQDAVGATSLPLDAFVYGDGNPGGLLRPDGSVAVPDAPRVYLPGDSWLATSSGWLDTYPTTPNQCP